MHFTSTRGIVAGAVVAGLVGIGSFVASADTNTASQPAAKAAVVVTQQGTDAKTFKALAEVRETAHEARQLTAAQKRLVAAAVKRAPEPVAAEKAVERVLGTGSMSAQHHKKKEDKKEAPKPAGDMKKLGCMLMSLSDIEPGKDYIIDDVTDSIIACFKLKDNCKTRNEVSKTLYDGRSLFSTLVGIISPDHAKAMKDAWKWEYKEDDCGKCKGKYIKPKGDDCKKDDPCKKKEEPKEDKGCEKKEEKKEEPKKDDCKKHHHECAAAKVKVPAELPKK